MLYYESMKAVHEEQLELERTYRQRNSSTSLPRIRPERRFN